MVFVLYYSDLYIYFSVYKFHSKFVKKCGCNFCGTHDKYQPHGIVSVDINEKSLTRCTISIIDINGINYYIDENNNVYDTKDIILNSTTPKIIGVIDNDNNKINMF